MSIKCPNCNSEMHLTENWKFEIWNEGYQNISVMRAHDQRAREWGKKYKPAEYIFPKNYVCLQCGLMLFKLNKNSLELYKNIENDDDYNEERTNR